MVGVAGRSKGCVTCRKRKKGCDLQRPECGQCRDRGSICGGYDTDLVFINRTCWPSVISSQANARTGETTRAQPQVWVPQGVISLAQPRVLPTTLTRSAFSEKSTEAMLNIFLSDGIVKARVSSVTEYASLIPRLGLHEDALRLMTLAIGLVVLGEEQANSAIVRQGRAFYGQALRELGVALQDPNRRRSEALLAVPQLLCLYEILFGASAESGKQGENWMSHAQGELVLLLGQDPITYSRPAAHALFKWARSGCIITAVRLRSATTMNDVSWKTLPWTNRVKTSEDTLLDILAELPEILGGLDGLDPQPKEGFQCQKLYLETLGKGWTAHEHLKAWLEKHSEEVYIPEKDEPVPIAFPNLGIALQSVRYWATALVLYEALDEILRISGFVSKVPYDNRPHTGLFAHHILRSIPYLFEKGNGFPGATSAAFPLGVALNYMRQSAIQEPSYANIAYKSWSEPMLPSTIKVFLVSMRSAADAAARMAPTERMKWPLKEGKPIL